MTHAVPSRHPPTWTPPELDNLATSQAWISGVALGTRRLLGKRVMLVYKKTQMMDGSERKEWRWKVPMVVAMHFGGVG